MSATTKFVLNNNRKTNGFWNDINNIKSFLKIIEQKFDIKSPDDWNKVKTADIKKMGGSRLLTRKRMFDIITIACPEYKLPYEQEIKHKRKPRGYWDRQRNIDNFIIKLKEKFNINDVHDWHKISNQDIQSMGGSSLLVKYKHLNDFKKLACPEYHDKYLKDKIISKTVKFWYNPSNVKNFIEQLRIDYQLNTHDDWNSLTKKQISNLGGIKLFKIYSLFEIKKMGCPNLIENEIDTIKHHPLHFWDNDENIKEFFNQLKQVYQLNTPKDWCSLKQKQILELDGGSSVLQRFSLFKIKSLYCPDEIYSIQCVKPRGFWEDEKNVKSFLEFLGRKYEFSSTDDWNNLSIHMIKKHGGVRILSKYTLFSLRCLVCDDYKNEFSHLQRNQKPHGYWDKQENIKEFCDMVEKKLNIQNKDDWCRISNKQLVSTGCGGLFSKFSIFDIVSIAYPKENWKESQFQSKGKRSAQRWLVVQLQKLFPNFEIIEDYFHNEFTRISGFSIQLDVYIPEIHLAFEYQGIQHYEDIPEAFASIETYKARDSEKLKICKLYKLPLVIIPHYWDGTLNFLRKAIENSPDIPQGLLEKYSNE